jgi:hypothetical protein
VGISSIRSKWIVFDGWDAAVGVPALCFVSIPSGSGKKQVPPRAFGPVRNDKIVS